MAKRDPNSVNWWRIAGVSALAAAVLTVGVGTVVHATRETPVVTSNYTPEWPEPPRAATSKPVAEVMTRLQDRSRPFTIAVIGDSTGVSVRGWVSQLGDHLGKATDRTVVFHQWSAEKEPDAYEGPRNLRTGGGGTIELWNGSASGENVNYSVKHLGELLPDGAVPDLVFVNHGHNQKDNNLQGPVAYILKKLSNTYPDAALVTILQNPEDPAVKAGSLKHDTNIENLRRFLDYESLPYVDVFDAYKAMPGWETQFTDNHPTEAGYAVWANAVKQVIGI